MIADMLVALTRPVPPSIARCELTHLERRPIDLEVARAQHAAYERALERLGCTVRRLPETPELPDSVFVEDAAVVLDEVAVITRPGAASRRAELASVADALQAYRPLAWIAPPGTLDGGDVLRIGRRLYVGRSGRTNEEGVGQLRAHAAPLGYEVVPLQVNGCLHLKTAVTQVAAGTVLLEPEWVDRSAFADMAVVAVAPGEPMAANALLAGSGLLYSSAFPRTLERLSRAGIHPVAVEATELAKAEAGLTCCSLVFRA